MIPVGEVLTIGKSIETEGRMVVPEDWGWEQWGIII